MPDSESSSDSLVPGEPVTGSSDLRAAFAETRPPGPAAPGALPGNSDSAILRAAQALMPPEVAAAPQSAYFGKFVRIKKLGQGGMGEVWKAWDTALGRWVALKFLTGGDETEIARFTQEAHVAGRLSHPNITAVYEVGEAQGRHFIAMQFIEGSTAAKLPRGDRRALARTVRDAALAVDEAHRAGVIHRDLKPDNLLVRWRGAESSGAEGWQVFVSDFGLARRTEGASGLSISGAIVGTPAYMAPEQARGDKVGPAADVYGLGATLYDLLCGRPPFRADGVFELLQAVQEQDPAPLRTRDAAIEADLDTIVLKCLEKDPGRRYPSAQALAADLDAWLEGDAIAARPASLVYRLGRKIRKRRSLVAIGTAGLLAVCTVLAVLVPAYRRESDARRRKEAALALWVQISGTLGEAEQLARAGRVDLQRAKLEESAEILRAAITREELPEARFFLGWVLHLEDRLDDAERELSRALFLKPDLGEAQVRRGLIRAERLLGAENEEILAVARESGVDDLAARHDLVTLVARRPEVARLRSGAIEDLAAISGQSSYFRPAQIGYGRALIAYISGRSAPAETELNAALALDPTLIEALEILGRIRFERGDFPGCAAALKEVVRQHRGRPATCLLLSRTQLLRARLDPWSPEAPAWRADALAAADLAAGIAGKTAATLLWRGTALGEAGQRHEALAVLTEAVERFPDMPLGRINRGALRLDSGDFQGALADYQSALAVFPNSARLRYNLGHAKAGLGDRAGAIADYDAAIAARPGFADAHFARAMTLAESGRFDEALADYDRAVALDAGHELAWNNRGNLLASRGRDAEAIDSYTRAIAAQASYPVPWFNRANTLARIGKPEDAAADYRKALALRSPWPEALVGLGITKVETGDAKGAVEDLSRALEALPASVDAHFNLGIAWAMLGKVDLAIDQFTETIARDGRHLEAWVNRGAARAGRGDLAAAHEDYSRALSLKEDPALYAARGQVRLRQGKRSEAVADWEQALAIAPADWPQREGVEKAVKLYREKKKKGE